MSDTMNVQETLQGHCRRLRCKEMFVDTGIEFKMTETGSGIFWCSHTQNVLGPDGHVRARQRVADGGEADVGRADDPDHTRLLGPGGDGRGQLSGVRGGGVHLPVGGNDQWSHTVNDDRAAADAGVRFGPSRGDARAGRACQSARGRPGAGPA